MPNTATSGHHRRLSARRGSLTALDPYAVHADINENPNRTSSSKLTIVRVLPSQPPQPPSAPITLNEAPSSFTSSSRRRRLGSSGAGGAGSGTGGAGSTSQADSPPPGRLSFAFSSFGSASGDPAQHQGGDHQRTGSGGPSSSPSSSPRIRPSSPRLAAGAGASHYHPYQHHHHQHHHHSGIALKPRLTPDQLVELARQATSPRTLAQIANSTSHSAGPASPAPSSAGGPGSLGASPVLRSQPLGAASAVSTNVAPATFTPLPDDIYLPFIDRPSEVAQLISIPPDAKLFALLSQTLPKTYEPPAGTRSPEAGEEELEELPRDPSLWTYDHLIYHLTQVDRDVAPDPIWTFAARKCILSHSELIWERVKGGLGVPPELDIDYDFAREATHQRSSSQEKFHAKMRKFRQELRDGAPKNRLGSDSQNESALDDDDDDALEESEDDEEDEGVGRQWTATASVRGVDQPSPAGNAPVAVERSDSAHEVGGVVIGSFNNPSSSIDIATVGPSPPMGATPIGALDDDDDVDDDEDFISIEPLIAPSAEAVGALGANPPPPLSLGTSALLEEGLASDTPAGEGMGLGDIAEGEEEEEEDGDNTGASTSEPAQQPTTEQAKQQPEEELIPPSQIQGLRILTSPVHAAGAYGVGGLFVPHHLHPSSLLHPTSTDGSTSLTDVSVMASPLPMTPSAGEEGGGGKTLAQVLASGAHETTSSTTTHTQPHVISPPAGGYRTHSRTSSFSSVTGISIGPFSRSESTGNLAALMAAQQHQQPHYSGSDAGDSAGYASDWSVGATGGGSNASVIGQAEVVGDRLPGQPLFVSNFARLNGCPTLKGGVPNPAAEQRRNHGPSRFKLKRTGSTGAVVGSVPSSNFVGPHAAHSHLSGHSKTPSDASETPSSPKARTYSHGSLYGQGRPRPGSWIASKGAN